MLSLNLHAISESPDVIVLTETNLTQDFDDAELGLPNYIIYRQDRNSLTIHRSCGGGVLIAVDKRITSGSITISCNSVEQKFIRLHNNSFKCLIDVVYLPPGSPAEAYHQHTTTVEEVAALYPDYGSITLGDFNLPDTTWCSQPSGLTASYLGYVSPNHKECVSHICNTFSYLNQRQLYPVHPNKGYSLDLLFASMPHIMNIYLFRYGRR